MKGVTATLGIAILGSMIFGSHPAFGSTAPSTPTGGFVNLYLSGSQSSRGNTLITGAIGDYGKVRKSGGKTTFLGEASQGYVRDEHVEAHRRYELLDTDQEYRYVFILAVGNRSCHCARRRRSLRRHQWNAQLHGVLRRDRYSLYEQQPQGTVQHEQQRRAVRSVRNRTWHGYREFPLRNSSIGSRRGLTEPTYWVTRPVTSEPLSAR